jgi:hypothetical protein
MSQFIRTYPGTLDPDTCKMIIQRYLADPRKRNESAEVGGFHQGKTSLDLNITSHDDWSALDTKVSEGVFSSFDRYVKDRPTILYALNGNDIKDNGYQIQHYRSNGRDGFDWHADVGGRTQPDGVKCSQRLLAGVLYLNTVEEGGETEFMDQSLKVKPTEGTMLWFPVSFEYVHRGCTPVSGDKFIISTFICYAE